MSGDRSIPGADQASAVTRLRPVLLEWAGAYDRRGMSGAPACGSPRPLAGSLPGTAARMPTGPTCARATSAREQRAPQRRELAPMPHPAMESPIPNRHKGLPRQASKPDDKTTTLDLCGVHDCEHLPLTRAVKQADVGHSALHSPLGPRTASSGTSRLAPRSSHPYRGAPIRSELAIRRLHADPIARCPNDRHAASCLRRTG
jgi:hypothetical protein